MWLRASPQRPGSCTAPAAARTLPLGRRASFSKARLLTLGQRCPGRGAAGKFPCLAASSPAPAFPSPFPGISGKQHFFPKALRAPRSSPAPSKPSCREQRSAGAEPHGSGRSSLPLSVIPPGIALARRRRGSDVESVSPPGRRAHSGTRWRRHRCVRIRAAGERDLTRRPVR